MIITCPNCQTRYQLAEKAIGNAGRKVQCAQCQQSWNAKPEKEAPPPPKPKLVAEQPEASRRRKNEDEIFSPEDEAALDAEFAEADKSDDADAALGDAESEDGAEDADQAKSKKSGKKSGKKVGLSRNYRAMLRRQAMLRRKLPFGRIRFHVRILVAAMLVLTFGGGFMFRTDIVRLLPDMAGVYSAIGMPVNINGLEFVDVETLRSVQNGVDVMLVTGRVHNVSRKQANVPPIEISILDADGNSVYSWNVIPVTRVLAPNEKIDFEARLNSAPADAQSIRIGFDDHRHGADDPHSLARK